MIHYQVTAPKKRPKETAEVEKAVPKTVKELADEKMGDTLKSAGQARSASIKLSNVPYGKDLSTELLTYAEASEGLFKELQSAMDSGNQKTLQSLLQKWEEKEREGEKAKAFFFWLVAAWVKSRAERPSVSGVNRQLHVQIGCKLGIRNRKDELTKQAKRNKLQIKPEGN